MNKTFDYTTVDEVKSIFKAGFKCIESRNVSPFQDKNDEVLLTRTGNVFRIYLRSKNEIEDLEDGRFTITFPFQVYASFEFRFNKKNKIDHLSFDAHKKAFNIIDAINQIKKIGVKIKGL